MRFALALIAALLLVAGIVLALVVFGPLKSLLPQGAQQTIEQQFPDFFTGGQGPGTLPAVTPGQGHITPQPDLWKLPTTDGSDIRVTPFAITPDNALPTSNVTIAGSGSYTSEYIIEYSARDQSFNIALFKEPLSEIRKKAEAEFLGKLNVSEAEACRLLYQVQTPSEVSEFYTGKNLGFSFCPGATQL